MVMKKRLITLAAAAAIIICGIAVKPAMAFFTDTATAEGKLELKLKDGELGDIEETVSDMVKHIVITNTGDGDVIVRVKAIYPDSCTVTVQDSADWSESDGYYVFNGILSAGDKTSELALKISNSTTADFNVVILQEATRVTYDEAGNPIADWDSAVVSQSNYEMKGGQ